MLISPPLPPPTQFSLPPCDRARSMQQIIPNIGGKVRCDPAWPTLPRAFEADSLVVTPTFRARSPPPPGLQAACRVLFSHACPVGDTMISVGSQCKNVSCRGCSCSSRSTISSSSGSCVRASASSSEEEGALLAVPNIHARVRRHASVWWLMSHIFWPGTTPCGRPRFISSRRILPDATRLARYDAERAAALHREYWTFRLKQFGKVH